MNVRFNGVQAQRAREPGECPLRKRVGDEDADQPSPTRPQRWSPKGMPRRGPSLGDETVAQQRSYRRVGPQGRSREPRTLSERSERESPQGLVGRGRPAKDGTDTHGLRVGDPRQNDALPGVNLGDGLPEKAVSPGSRRGLDARWLEYVVHLTEQVGEQGGEQPAHAAEHKL